MKTLRERFDSKWTPEPNSGCWLWLGAVSGGAWGGYGIIRIGGRNRQAHRISWELFKGEIPLGMQVCHTCDTPGCVNPNHLFVGTQSDNQKDCNSKGRRDSRGELNGRAKLTSELATMIKSSGKNKSELSREFGISRRQISRIKTGEHWNYA